MKRKLARVEGLVASWKRRVFSGSEEMKEMKGVYRAFSSPEHETYYQNYGIKLYTDEAIEGLRRAGRIAGNVLQALKPEVKPGVTTKQLADSAKEMILSAGAVPSSIGYMGFPETLCSSVGKVACHGIPNSTPLEAGEVVSLDVTCELDGWYGDTCYTYLVGECSDQLRKFDELGKNSLWAGIREVKPGATLADVGSAIEKLTEDHGSFVITDFCGHGIGRKMHEAPNVLHASFMKKILLSEGMVFTIEPILCQGAKPSGVQTEILDDGWTAVALADGPCVQYEHVLAVTRDGFDVLTLPDDPEGWWRPTLASFSRD